MLQPRPLLAVVDDSAIDRQYLDIIVKVKKVPIDIMMFSDPTEVSAHLQQHGWPDILLVDIRMPLLTGFELLDQLQQSHSVRPPNNQIYIYSSSSHSDDRAQAQAHPWVNGFIEKPIRADDLQMMLEKVVQE